MVPATAPHFMRRVTRAFVLMPLLGNAFPFSMHSRPLMCFPTLVRLLCRCSYTSFDPLQHIFWFELSLKVTDFFFFCCHCLFGSVTFLTESSWSNLKNRYWGCKYFKQMKHKTLVKKKNKNDGGVVNSRLCFCLVARDTGLKSLCSHKARSPRQLPHKVSDRVNKELPYQTQSEKCWESGKITSFLPRVQFTLVFHTGQVKKA